MALGLKTIFGIALKAEDKGMRKGLGESSKALELLSSAVEKLNSLVTINKLQAFIEGISLRQLDAISHKIGETSEHLQTLGESGRQLTNSLEATFFEGNRSAKMFGATVGLAGKDLKAFQSQAVSMSYEMGISSSEAEHALYGFQGGSQALTAMGITSAKEFAKFGEMTGISTKDFGWNMGQMQKQTGMTDEELKVLANQFVATGTDIGDFSKVMESLPNMAKIITKRMAFGDTRQQAVEFIRQQSMLTKVMYDTGIKDASQFSEKLGELMTESKENFSKMFSGTESELSKWQTDLAIAGMDVKKVFDAMKQGPSEFMLTFAKQAEGKEPKALAKVMEFVTGHLSQTMGQSAEELSAVMSDPVKRMKMLAGLTGKTEAQIAKELKDGTDLQIAQTQVKNKALEQVIKDGWSGKFNLEQRFERAETLMITKFRQAGLKNTREFVEETEKAFGEFGKDLENLSKAGGPIAEVVEGLSTLHSMGAIAIVPKDIRQVVLWAATSIKNLAPVLGTLAGMFLTLGGPLTVISVAVGGLVAWFAQLMVKTNSLEQTLSIMGSSVSKFFFNLPWEINAAMLKLTQFLTGKDVGLGSPGTWVKFFKTVGKALKDAWTQVRGMISELWDGFLDGLSGGDVNSLDSGSTQLGTQLGIMFKGAITYAKTKLKDLGSFLKELWTGFSDALMGNAPKAGENQKLGAQIARGLKEALKWAWSELQKGFDDLLKGDLTVESAVVGWLGLEAVLTIAPLVITAFGGIATAISDVAIWFAALEEGSMALAVIDGIGTALGALAGPVGLVVLLTTAVLGLAAAFKADPAAAKKFVDEVGVSIKNFFKNAGEWLTSGLIYLVDTFIGWATGPGGASFGDGLVGMMKTSIPRFFEAVMFGVNSVIDWIGEALIGFVDGVENALIKRFPKSAQSIEKVFEFLRTFIGATVEVVKFLANAVGYLLVGAVEILMGGLYALVKVVKFVLYDQFVFYLDMLQDAFFWLVDKASDALRWFDTEWPKIWEKFKRDAAEALNSIIEFFTVKLPKVWEDTKDSFLNNIYDPIVNGMEKVVEKIKHPLDTLGGMFGNFFDKTDERIDTTWGHSMSTIMAKDLDKATNVTGSFADRMKALFAKVSGDASSTSADLSKIAQNMKVPTLPTMGFQGAGLDMGKINAAVAPKSRGFGGFDATPTPKLPPPIQATPLADASVRDAALINAVHMPQWYVRYEAVFQAQMQTLIAAQKAARPGPTKPGDRNPGSGLTSHMTGDLNGAY